MAELNGHLFFLSFDLWHYADKLLWVESMCNVCLSTPLAKATTLFSRQTKAIVWGMQTRAVQGMLDFDYVCSRDEPSVVAMVYPFT